MNSMDAVVVRRCKTSLFYQLVSAEKVRILEIRRRFGVGGVTKRVLGRQFGISESQAGNIVRGKAWRHV